jgi:cysteine-rich repeat protein
VCGDGALDLGEDCDDGNLVGGDGCEDDCTSSDDVLPEWTLELGGPTGFVDVGSGVAFDSVGNLIVSAYTEPDVIWIRKYDTAYNELWTVTYPGIPGSAYSRVRVAVDGNDNIGFSGDVPDAGVSIKFGMLTPGGVELWTQTVGPGLDAGVDFDPNGNLLLAGAFLQASTDVWVAKYDPLGIEFWSDTYDSAGGSADAARTVASDPFGNVLVIGVANAPGDTHIVVRKYDPNGVVQWTDLVDGAAGESDWGWGVAVAANGDVLAGGVIRDVPLDGDGWLRRYEPGGTELWTQNYAGTANISGDGILDVATGAAGGIYVCGSIEDIGGQRYWVAKLDAAGQPVWERRKIESGQWLDVAVASDGRVAVAGTVNFPFPFDAEARFAVYPP